MNKLDNLFRKEQPEILFQERRKRWTRHHVIFQRGKELWTILSGLESKTPLVFDLTKPKALILGLQKAHQPKRRRMSNLIKKLSV
jgi:hypothetical protein